MPTSDRPNSDRLMEQGASTKADISGDINTVSIRFDSKVFR